MSTLTTIPPSQLVGMLKFVYDICSLGVYLLHYLVIQPSLSSFFKKIFALLTLKKRVFTVTRSYEET